MERSIFKKSQEGQKAFSLPKSDKEFDAFLPQEHLLRKKPLDLPEISELDLMRHFSRLAQKNFGIDVNFYPLGSCTMKYNPRINEKGAALKEFTNTHPLAPHEFVEGNLELQHALLTQLTHLCGMHGGTLAPSAGAQGEFAGIKTILAYHDSLGQQRDEVLIPDSAHGTNAATCTMVGLKVIVLKSAPDGDISIDELKNKLSSKTAALMLTNPNTLGLFSEKILEIEQLVHGAGALLYYDGANLNPLIGVCRPGDMGFDVMHLNVHKTFSTPHGGGGPGAGPVLCKKYLIPFLPKIAPFHGNFAVLVRAYLYILLHGFYGLRKVAQMATLNANYLKHHLGSLFKIPYEKPCMHEFVAQASPSALDIAKRLIDFGIHPPTVYFPQIVKEAMLIEPTETESKETLDLFIEAMRQISQESQETLKGAPYTTEIQRPDEAYAARCPCLKN